MLHVGARLLAERAALAQRLPEQVSGGEVHQAELAAEGRRLRPLARADRADQQEDPAPRATPRAAARTFTG